MARFDLIEVTAWSGLTVYMIASIEICSTVLLSLNLKQCVTNITFLLSIFR
jgi:hypothetical protein